MNNNEFYQIYYRQHPLQGFQYANRRDARKGLEILYKNLEACAPLLGYTIRKRLTVPMGNILAVEFTYNDGSTRSRTFVIQRVRSQVVMVNTF